MKNIIENIFQNLMSIQSDTGTEQEVKIAEEIYSYLSNIRYFQDNSGNLIKQKVEGDPFNRFNVIGLIRGTTDKTVIFIHHHDAVDIDSYDEMKSVAFESELLKKELLKKALPDEVHHDLLNPDWLFGRGSADMKAGAAVQIALLETLSEDASFHDNIVLLSVCDEENLSVGMRQASAVLNQLKKEYNLDYRVMINSEPVARISETQGIYYEGTVGKLMPVIYTRGKTAHIGEVLSGLNPLLILSEIQSRIELNPEFTDEYKGEVTPPPTWVHYRDRKLMYDASIPETASAYFSVLTLNTSPQEIMRKIKVVSTEAFENSIQKYETCVKAINKKSKKTIMSASFQPRVMAFEELNQMLIEKKGDSYIKEIKVQSTRIKEKLDCGDINLQSASIEIMEKAVSFLDDKEPIVVIGFSGPFYPHLTNDLLVDERTSKFEKIINDVSFERFNMNYVKHNYFMGISDFSYSSLKLEESDINIIEKNMLGWGQLYSIPFESLKTIEIPMVNLGPWGKDLHKVTERVNKEDLFNRLPKLIEGFIRAL